FHYRLLAGQISPGQNPSSDIHRYLHGRHCRWQRLLELFGFNREAVALGKCGHCDNCQRGRR
ncbi:recombinase RecQ, partial [filamentous cyanobacterium CCP5]